MKSPSPICLILLALLAVSPLRADWKYVAKSNGPCMATTTATGTSPDGPIKATLNVEYSSGKKGVLTLDFVVAGAFKMKGFGFEEFEGPDAPAAKRKLTRITVEKPGGKPLTVNVTVAGWYLDDSFHFAANEENKNPADVLKAVRAMQAGATKVSVTVVDLHDARKTLHADFASADPSAALAKLLKDK